MYREQYREFPIADIRVERADIFTISEISVSLPISCEILKSIIIFGAKRWNIWVVSYTIVL